jgi:hypothetical protein
VQDLITRLESRLHQGAAADADSRELASRVASLWRSIGAEFSPIVGQQGFKALLRRAISISLSQVSCFSAALVESPSDDEFAGLRTALAQQPQVDAMHANTVLLSNFTNLLVSLIGPDLTERLLSRTLAQPSSDNVRQEESP